MYLRSEPYLTERETTPEQELCPAYYLVKSQTDAPDFHLSNSKEAPLICPLLVLEAIEQQVFCDIISAERPLMEFHRSYS